MKSTLQIEAKVSRLINYIEEIEKGILQIPDFQRDFIWTNKDKLDLFDSLKRGYPIGSIIFWAPKPLELQAEPLRFGPFEPAKNAAGFFYVLDGFQRLSTIFGALIDPKKTSLKCDIPLWKKEFNIHYDLENEEFFIPRYAVDYYQIPLFQLIRVVFL